MTPAEFKGARESMGMNQIAFAAALGLGANGRRQISRIENGATISGPMSLAVQKLLDDHARMISK